MYAVGLCSQRCQIFAIWQQAQRQAAKEICVVERAKKSLYARACVSVCTVYMHAVVYCMYMCVCVYVCMYVHMYACM